MSVLPQQQKQLTRDKWPEGLKREVARIKRWEAVIDESISISTSEEDDRLYINLTIKTNDLAEPIKTQILDAEPVALVYLKEKVGVNAPTVWSQREGFPRNIGHINPTRADQPASLCLARAGHQNLYDHHGVDGIMEQLISWLNDAKTGDLMRDGWEPVPAGEGQNTRIAYYDARTFQEIAANNSDTKWACGITEIFAIDPSVEESRRFVLRDQIDISSEVKRVFFSNLMSNLPRKEPGRENVASYIPWIYVWSDQAQPISEQFFGVWNTFDELLEGTKSISFDETVLNSVMGAFNALGEEVDVEHTPGDYSRSYVLLLGVWRPKPLVEDIYGLSKNKTARSLELKAYLLRRSGYNRNPVEGSQQVQQLTSLSRLSPEMLSYMSGIDYLPSIAFFGYGALGSAIADNLLRSGAKRLAVMDKDWLSPHNVARHVGFSEDTMKAKVDTLERHSSQLTYAPDEIEIKKSESDICAACNEQLTAFVEGYDVVIDATADERVRKKLCELSLEENQRLLRAEIYNNGKLGILFLAGPQGNPNLIDLYYQLCHKSLENDEISSWLRAVAKGGAGTEDLLLGMGCSSATTRMPKYVISQHAAACMPKIFDVSGTKASAGFGINPLDQNNLPLGWKWFDVSPSVVLKAEEENDWKIRLSEHVANKLIRLREENGDFEVGGYLYGGFDYALKQIYVIEVTGIPPKSLQTPTYLKLGPAGKTPLERRLIRKAGSKIVNVGTWHSHPRCGPQMSQKDRKTMEGFYERDKIDGIPTLLVVTSLEGLKAHLWT